MGVEIWAFDDACIFLRISKFISLKVRYSLSKKQTTIGGTYLKCSILFSVITGSDQYLDKDSMDAQYAA